MTDIYDHCIFNLFAGLHCYDFLITHWIIELHFTENFPAKGWKILPIVPQWSLVTDSNVTTWTMNRISKRYQIVFFFSGRNHDDVGWIPDFIHVVNLEK